MASTRSVFASALVTLLGCRCDRQEPPATGELAPHPGSNSVSATSLDSAAGRAIAQPEFLVVTDRGEVARQSPDGPGRVLTRGASALLHDPAHELLWFVRDGRLSVIDFRTSTAVPIAGGLSDVASLWAQWSGDGSVRFVRPSTGCEPTNVAEVEIGDEPRLKLLRDKEPRPLDAEGLSWLTAQRSRKASQPASEEGFGVDARRIALPSSWTRCEDPSRCGLSAPFGSSGTLLVLVRDQFGADCWHRSCLLFDPGPARFASPPVAEDEATGRLSTLAGPMRWGAAEDVTPGVCGPYRFDVSGSRFLVRRFHCQLGSTCQEVGGETVGWLVPGAVVGEPG